MAAKTVKKVASKSAAKAAPRRSRAKKKSDNSEAVLPSKQEQSFLNEFLGLFLIALSVVAAISIVSHFAQGLNGNLMGPYVGSLFALTLNRLTGSVPAIILLLTVGILGARLTQRVEEGGSINLKLPLVFCLLFIEAAVLLSIKYVDLSVLTHVHFEDSGGIIGNYLVQKALVPVFGRSAFGPYLICAIFVFFTIIWGFKIRIAQIIEKSVEFLGIFYYPILDGLENAKSRYLARKKASAEQASLLQISPPDADMVKAGRGKRSRPKILASEDLQVPVAEDEPVLAPLIKEESIDESGDPLEIRKKRDRARQIKHISELNEWEVQNRDPSIGGLLSKAKNGRNASKITESETPPSMDPEDIVLEKGFDEDSNDEESTSNTNNSKLNVQEPVEAPKPKPKPEVKYDDYVVPNIDEVFKAPPEQEIYYTEDQLKEQAASLIEHLSHFKVMGKVVGICPGPVIIRYEIELAPGIKVSQISSLSDDLALALSAKSIRILAPIPGKNAVGIEVPTKKPQIVYIRDILKSSRFKPEPDSLKLVLGKDIGGDPMVMDLTRAPHLLIAGQTGSGKSVGINSFMASLLCSKTPDEVRLILVDPKVVELKPYEGIPHLLAPVINKPEIAVQALKWATIEMDRRYEVLACAAVRNIKGFNQKFRAGELKDKVAMEDHKIMPYIVIIIDELADLMMVAGKEVEISIARIAQKARAVGLHLILATQRPSTNVITGTIKANLPTRVAFQVASHIDARTIMDKAGCEKLLGRGDMLFRSIESPEPERIHGSWVSDEEAEAIAQACAEQFVNYPQVESFNIDEDDDAGEQEDMPRDAKFRPAAEMVCSIRQASASLLQRRMSIGYARAGRLMDQLERAGVVGRDRGSKPREVLMDEMEVASFLSSGLND